MIDAHKQNNQLQAYVLDLLTVAEKQQVEEMAAADEATRTALQQERQVGQLVRSTLHQTTAPENGRLAQLMPPIPRKRRWEFLWGGWQRQLAAVCALAIIFWGSLSLLQLSPNGFWQNGVAPFVAATATNTQEPTATQTDPTTEPTSTAVAVETVPLIVATPSPPPTPIAALPVSSN